MTRRSRVQRNARYQHNTLTNGRSWILCFCVHFSNSLQQLRKAYEEGDDERTAAAMTRKRITPPLADNDLRWFMINKRQLSSETSPPPQLSSAPQTSTVTSVMTSPSPLPQQLSSAPQTSVMTSPSPPPPQLSPAPQTSAVTSPTTSPSPPPQLSPTVSSPPSPPSPPSSLQPSSAMFSPVSPSYYPLESTSSPSSSPVLLPCHPIPLLTIEQSKIILEEAISNIVMNTTVNTPLTVAQATHAVCTSMTESLLSEDLQSYIIHDIASFNPWLL